MSRPSSKSQWRHICQAQRAQLTPVQIHTLSQQICANLRASQILDTAACVLGYWAVKGGKFLWIPSFRCIPKKSGASPVASLITVSLGIATTQGIPSCLILGGSRNP